MQFFQNFIIHHISRILVFMILVCIAFIVYLPSNAIIIWAFASIWSITLIALILALSQTNKTLQGFKETLHTTMDPSVVELMIAKKLRTENRPISVQFTDLKGFTSYAEEKSAEVVLSELNTYLREMEAILLEYHAHIDKYMGDGIMSEFGAPNTYIKHALLSVASGWKMQQTMERFPWQLRVGVATGVSTIGIIGTKRQAYTAFGDVVNLASRIEGLSEPGRVTVDEVTYRECKDYFDFTQKSFSTFNQLENSELTSSIKRAKIDLDKEADNCQLLIKLSDLLLEACDTQQAIDCLEKAMTIAPDDNDIKIAFANASIKHNEQINLEVKGRKRAIKVYELIGLKCPLGDFRNIPEHLYYHQKNTIESLLPFPEDLTLPVETLDGSIGQGKLVGICSYLIADKLELSADEKKNILEAGYLADIGKSIVPESILNRPGQLTNDETKFIHQYPAESVRKLRALGYKNEDMLSIVASHHESNNGSGYPEGLAGDNIPLGSRIVAVAAAYISLTSNRPYRDAWEVKPAYQELVKYSNQGKFDLEVTEALGEIISEL